jgi:hypothetical protein
MTFTEFLGASGQDLLNQAIASASIKNSLAPLIHDKILDRLKIYLVIGGMPRVVEAYITGKGLDACQVELDNILNSFYDDFAKYHKKIPMLRLQEVFKSVVYQSGNKFKYSNVGEGNAGTYMYKDALELLVRAGLVYKVFHTAARGLPLGGQVDLKKFKALIFDTGVFQRVQGLNISEHIIADFSELVNKGNLCELFVGIESMAGQSPRIRPEVYYWHREARSSNAEVDYVISLHNQVLPIEVKAGIRGHMQSLRLFMEERKLEKGFRISSENFSTYDKIISIPLYAVPYIYHKNKVLSH